MADRILDVHRAARLAGVSRERIQELMAAGELISFEGRVSLASLNEIFPEISSSKVGMLEIVEQIKEDSVAKGLRDGMTGSPSSSPELNRQLNDTLHELNHHRRLNREYLSLIQEMVFKLEHLRDRGGNQARAQALINWLKKQLKAIR
jgi:hypothetical protein